MSSAGQGLRWQWAEGWVSVLPQLPLPGPPLFPDPCQGQGVCVCVRKPFVTASPPTCPALPCPATRGLWEDRGQLRHCPHC